MKIAKVCGLSMLLISGFLEAEVVRGSPFGELMNAHISRGYAVSTGGNFFGVSFQVSSSLAESAVGQSAEAQSTFVLNSGLINPNRDLIFINGIDLIFFNNLHTGEQDE